MTDADRCRRSGYGSAHGGTGGAGRPDRPHRRAVGRPAQRSANRWSCSSDVDKYFGDAARAAAHQSHGPQGRGRRRARSVRVGQVHAVPGDQPAGDDPGRDRSPSTARSCPRRARRWPICGPTSAWCSSRSISSPTRRSWRTSPSGRSRSGKKSAADAKKRGHGAAQAGRRRSPGRQVPGAAVRRPAAAGRDRPGAGHGPEGDLVRRADLGPGSRDGQRGARRDGRPGPARA